MYKKLFAVSTIYVAVRWVGVRIYDFIATDLIYGFYPRIEKSQLNKVLQSNKGFLQVQSYIKKNVSFLQVNWWHPIPIPKLYGNL